MKLYYYVDTNGTLQPQSFIVEIEGSHEHLIQNLRANSFDIDLVDGDPSLNLKRYDVNDIIADVHEYRKGNHPPKNTYFVRFMSATSLEPNFVDVDNLRCRTPEEALETALSYSFNNPRWDHIRNDTVIAEISRGHIVVLRKEVTIESDVADASVHDQT